MDAPGAPGPGPGRKELKIVIVGDGGCGKTSLLMVYSQGSFPEDYAPSVFEKYTASVTVGSKEVTLNLYDTAGQEDYDRLRPLSYQNTHLVLICYDVMNPTSYDNVLIKVRPGAQPVCFKGGGHGSGLSPMHVLSLHSGSLRSHISAVGPPWCSLAARQTCAKIRSSCGSSGPPSWSPSPTCRARSPVNRSELRSTWNVLPSFGRTWRTSSEQRPRLRSVL
uniref:Ras homolog family member F, filopodia associated n=1 Tax=Canis lupus dingo TaxID=286419 RepID=A0A8C0KV94_CANLU